MFENIQPYLFVSVSILSSPESSKMENTHFNPLFEVGIITLTVCEFRRTCDEDQLKLTQMCVRRRRGHKKASLGSDRLISLNIPLIYCYPKWNTDPTSVLVSAVALADFEECQCMLLQVLLKHRTVPCVYEHFFSLGIFLKRSSWSQVPRFHLQMDGFL